MVVAAFTVAVVITRRVTRRGVELAEAITKVGAGDLTVDVPTNETDEIGDLTRAFNSMVHDLRESRSRIEYLQRINAWQEFARRLAHEIKNPLTPIQLAMQEIQRSYRGDDEQYRRKLGDALSIVEEEIATLRRMVGEFSAFARLPEVRPAPADLNDFLRDLMRSLEIDGESPADTSIESTPIEMSFELAGEPLPVLIDTMMLKRCLDNLVQNARQAIRQGGSGSGVLPKEDEPRSSRSERVRIRTFREGARAVIEVADNGPGIPPADRDQVFDPYYSTKSEGTGLGLAIVKKVVLEHEGEIKCVDSDLGGIAFRIAIPLTATNDK